jgi:hypothetical protein
MPRIQAATELTATQSQSFGDAVRTLHPVVNIPNLHVVVDVSGGCIHSAEQWIPQLLKNPAAKNCTMHLVGMDTKSLKSARQVQTLLPNEVADGWRAALDRIGGQGEGRDGIQAVRKRIPTNAPVLAFGDFYVTAIDVWMTLGTVQTNIVTRDEESFRELFNDPKIWRMCQGKVRTNDFQANTMDAGEVQGTPEEYRAVTKKALEYLYAHRIRPTIADHEF